MDKDTRDGALQNVTFEQAKRLKAVGYDWCCRSWYNSDGVFRSCDFSEVENYNGSDGLFTAPTVALALKWCRDVKSVKRVSFVSTQTADTFGNPSQSRLSKKKPCI